MTVSILSSHRRVPPYGMAGGHPGDLGRQWVEHPDGRVTPLAGCDSVQVGEGDVFVLETPGGGGYGPPASPDSPRLRAGPLTPPQGAALTSPAPTPDAG